jgi:hypothetical protein
MKCPQCSSNDCGPYRCRFSNVMHAIFRENQYAQAMIQRDKEQPKWLRNLLTGGLDVPNGQ